MENIIEENFVETAVTATISMDEAPEQPVIDENKHNNNPSELEVSTATNVPRSELQNRDRQWLHSTINDEITTEVFLCRGPEDNTLIMGTFVQGTLFTVCVQLSARDERIRIASIDEFTWQKTRLSLQEAVATPGKSSDDLGTFLTASDQNHGIEEESNRITDVNSSNSNSSSSSSNNNNNTVLARQQALQNGASAHVMSIYNGCRDDGEGRFCSFSTILLADFYGARGTVSGTGSISLEFIASEEDPTDGASGNTREGGTVADFTGEGELVHENIAIVLNGR